MTNWRLRVLGLLAATLALAVPASASGAVTIGSDLAPDPTTSPDCPPQSACTLANFSFPGQQVSPPFDGVVVRWRIRSGGDADVADEPVRLKVVRNVGGGGYMGVSTSASRTISDPGPTPKTFTFPTRQPITVADLVALDLDSDHQNLIIRALSQTGVTFARWQPSLLDGQERAPEILGPPGDEHLFNADVEPDADGDGYGDETQDECPTDASTQGACGDDGAPPPDDGAPLNDFSFGKVKKNKRRGTAKLTVKVPGAGQLDLAKTKKVKADDESAEDAGNEKLSIKPKGKAKKKLNDKGKAKVKANVTYTPDGGTPNTEDKKIKLKKR
jgi:hypothetical protein